MAARRLLPVAALSVAALSCVSAQNISCTPAGSLYSTGFPFTYLNGSASSLAAYAGQVLMITNVATYWGETVSHYTGLNQLIAKIANPKFSVLGYPCNQFGGQEPGDNDEILNGLKYVRPGGGYSPAFPLTQKVDVNGLGADVTWNFLRASCPSPTPVLVVGNALWSPIQTADMTWNFNSFLVNKAGYVVRRYDTLVQPPTQLGDVLTLLNQSWAEAASYPQRAYKGVL